MSNYQSHNQLANTILSAYWLKLYFTYNAFVKFGQYTRSITLPVVLSWVRTGPLHSLCAVPVFIWPQGKVTLACRQRQLKGRFAETVHVHVQACGLYRLFLRLKLTFSCIFGAWLAVSPPLKK